MVKTAIVALVVEGIVVAGAGAYFVVSGPSATSLPPSGFSQTNQTTSSGNTITTYSGSSTVDAAYSTFRTSIEAQGWTYKEASGAFGGYTGNIYEKGDDVLVV